MSNATVHLRLPEIGDYVTIHNYLCEWHGVSGEIVGISDFPNNDTPYMVKRSNFDVWPFAIDELELHSGEEAYEGGWIDHYTAQLLKLDRETTKGVA